MMTLVIPTIAQEPDNRSASQKVGLEFHRTTVGHPTVHRTPMHLNIEAYYNVDTHTINILYDGECNGEVYLYLNDTVINYSSEINTSFQISGEPGLYQIGIIGENWVAQGCLQL